VSAVASPRRTDTLARPRTTFAERLLAAAPLASIYLWLCMIYLVGAWKRVTPWLFTDELELTQLSRSIAATGRAARRGEPHSFESLYTYLTAPVWLIHDVAAAYSAIKYLDVFVMASVLFPTYFLARMVVGRVWALFAATGAAAIPSLAYSSWIVEETLAYPYAALCFLLIAKALVTRRRAWIAGAVAGTLVAPLVRGELVVMPIILLLSILFALWSSEWSLERRRSWTRGDYIGFFTLVAGVVFAVSGYVSWHSHEWIQVTAYNWTKHRIFLYGDWAAGALAIGLGVIPFVAGLAGFVPVRGEKRTRELRMIRSVGFAALIAFGLYTAMKAAYLSMNFATRVEERNLIYIAPLLFIGTALVLERRRVNLIALAAAAAYGFYLVVGTPFFMDRQLYSDALGLAILEQANRFYEWTPAVAQWVLIGLLAGGLALVLAVNFLRDRRALSATLAAVLGVGLLAWNVTGQLAAAAGNVSVSRELEQTLQHPFTWVDDVAGGKKTLYLAQGVPDQNPEWLLEFWNRSIVSVSSIDASVQGPGPAGAPNITPTGKLYWTTDPADVGREYDYAVEDLPCVDFAGTFRKRHFYNGGADTLKEWRLIQLTKPNRLRAECTGIYPDGWTGPNDSTYFRFAADRQAWLRITISRQNWPSTPVHVQLSSIVAVHHQPVAGKLLLERRVMVDSVGTRVLWLRTPATPFTARVVVDQKFVPRDVYPQSGDPRTLGAQVKYRFFTKLPAGAQP
jgi:hypothetical protein